MNKKKDGALSVVDIAATVVVMVVGAAAVVVGIGLVSFGWHAGAIIAGAVLS